jgi:hypothetical protein
LWWERFGWKFLMVGEAGADVSGGPRGSVAGFIPHPAPAGGLFDGLTSLDVGVFEEIRVLKGENEGALLSYLCNGGKKQA